ncbi:MAG: hypothetical protein J7J98_06420 [candidate division Zixibacteria bacterium]|nr:hypothetical protein [candidate division Zixibacteria bacterium]
MFFFHPTGAFGRSSANPNGRSTTFDRKVIMTIAIIMEYLEAGGGAH